MTKIEWTHPPGYKGETWNPIVGCSVISPGCRHCYAMRFAGLRLENNPATPHYSGTTEPSSAGPVWTGKIAKAPETIFEKPLHWTPKKPRCVFVNSMGDLFHEETPDFLIDQAFAIMALSPAHLFLVLTKRAGRMRRYIENPQAAGRIYGLACDIAVDLGLTSVVLIAPGQDERAAPPGPRCHLGAWPIPNVWLGVSAEDQRRADERIPDLLATPAAVRFVSAEPLLGPIDFGPYLSPHYQSDSADFPKLGELDWIIAGGESGPGARPAQPDWIRKVRDQCEAAGAAFFFKQWGENMPRELVRDGRLLPWRRDPFGAEAWSLDELDVAPEKRDPVAFARVGKKAAGAILDGRTHQQWPAILERKDVNG